jgi:hypothetical protein
MFPRIDSDIGDLAEHVVGWMHETRHAPGAICQLSPRLRHERDRTIKKRLNEKKVKAFWELDRRPS